MSSRAPLLAGAGLLLALAIAGYLPARGGTFQFDDVPTIVENARLRDPGALAGTVATDLGALQRGLTDLTFAFDYARAGLDPAAFHTTSLALHLLAVALAFLLALTALRDAGRPRPEGLALAAAGLWGLHPLLSQAVSYLSQRAEGLCSLLYLAALLLLLAAYRRGRSPAGAALYAGGTLAFWLALQAKLVAITLPSALLLYLAAFEVEPPGTPPRRRWASRLAAAGPLLALSAIFAWQALRGIRGHLDIGFAVEVPDRGSYPLTQLRVVFRYLGLLFWPAGQNLDYDLDASRSLLDPPQTLAGAAGLVLLLGGAAWLRARARRPGVEPRAAAAGRLLAFGAAWFVLLLTPSSSLVPVADLIFEHRAYLASLGPVLAVAAAVDLALHRWLRPAPAARAGLAAALLGWAALCGLLRERNRVWTSPVTLWADVVAKAPRKARAHFNYGHALSAAGDEQAAIAQYNLASTLMGRDTVDWFRVIRNLGASLVAVGRPQEALAVLEQGLAREPGNAELLNNQALAWKRLGDLERAEKSAVQALRSAPGYAQAWNTLGEVRTGRRDYAGAMAAFANAARLAPDLLPPVHNIAVLQEATGQRAAACGTWLRFGQMRGGEAAGKAAAERARLGCGR